MSKIYCYKRASRSKQDFFRQDKILNDKGYINGVNCEFIEEHFTGKTIKRPVFEDLIKNKLQEGDTLVATELSRISRSVKDFNNLIDELLKKKKVNIFIIKENFNLLANGNMDAMTKLILNITSAFAEFERDIISDRTKDSLAYKKIHGTKTGNKIGREKSNYNTKENFINTLEYMSNNNVGYRKAMLKTKYPQGSFIYTLKKCYNKYNTNEYKEIIKKLKEDTTKWECF